jgi:hypothetical protein
MSHHQGPGNPARYGEKTFENKYNQNGGKDVIIPIAKVFMFKKSQRSMKSSTGAGACAALKCSFYISYVLLLSPIPLRGEGHGEGCIRQYF